MLWAMDRQRIAHDVMSFSNPHAIIKLLASDCHGICSWLMAQQWWGPAVKSKSDVDEEHEDTSQNLASPNRDEQEAAGCTMPKRLKRLSTFGELCKTQRHLPLELPDDEDEKDTEMQGDQQSCFSRKTCFWRFMYNYR